MNDFSTKFARILTDNKLTVNISATATTASISQDMSTVTIPNYVSDLKREVLESYIIHEAAGHAVMTPVNPVHKNIEYKNIDELCLKLNVPFTLINILEDERIERLLKIKYAGAKTIFNKSYKILYFEEQKFEIEPTKVNKENFITKLNVYFKVGLIAGVSFNKKELEIINDITKNQTFSDVIDSVISLNNFLKENKKSKPENQVNDQEENQVNDQEENQESTKPAISEQIKNQGDDQEENRGDDQEENQGNDQEENQGNDQEENQGNDQEEINKNEYYEANEIVDVMSKCQNSDYVPTNKQINIDKITNEYLNKNVMFTDKLKTIIKSVDTEEINILYANVLVEAKKIAIVMQTEFNLKKSAAEYQNSSICKSGELNEDCLFDYKTNNNLFLDSKVTRSGKNHGFVVLLDCSGSMLDYSGSQNPYKQSNIDKIKNTKLYKSLIQVYAIYIFCKSEDIRFKSFIFTDTCITKSRKSLCEILTDSTSKELNVDIIKNLILEIYYNCAYIKNVYSCPAPKSIFNFNGTPTTNVLYLMTPIVKEFKRKNNIEILNFINLTDGKSSSNTLMSSFSDYMYSYKNQLIFDMNSNKYINNYRFSYDNCVIFGLTILKANVDIIYSEFAIICNNRDATDLNSFKEINNNYQKQINNLKIIKSTISKNGYYKVEDKFLHSLIDNQFIYSINCNYNVKIKDAKKQKFVELKSKSKLRNGLNIINKLIISSIV